MPPLQQSQLSSTSVFETDLPYPVVDVEASEKIGKLALAQHPTQKLIVESASELITRSVKTSLFRTKGGENSQLDIVHDGNGQAMIFSIGSDERFYCVLHVDKTAHPWQLLDLTPVISGADPLTVSAFDVLEVGKSLHLAVSVKHKLPEDSAQEVHQIYWASLKQPRVEMGEDGKLQGFAPTDLDWKPVTNNLGPRTTTRLMCSPKPDSTQSAFTIFATTETTSMYIASIYAIDPNPSNEKPWTVINFGAQSNRIVELQPVVLGGASRSSKKRAGLALLHEAPGLGSDVVRRCNIVTLNDGKSETFAQYSLNTDKIGKMSSIYTSLNSWDTHDIVVAGNGIAFHQFQNLNHPCLDKHGQVIMPEITFRQVFCKETMLANPRRYILSLLAVSEDNELYVIDGERDANNFGLPSFQYSGLPIRRDVAQIACHFNKELKSMEFIYTTTRDNQIYHLTRDSETSTWITTDLQIAGPTSTTKERQYVTTITLSDSEGNPVPEGYPVSLTSEPIFVKINDLSYRLNRNRQTHVMTNSSGQIELVTTAPQRFGVSDIDVTLIKFAEKPYVFSVNMGERVMNVLSSIRSKEDLRNMTSATGQPLLEHVSDDKLEVSASLLCNFDALKKSTTSVSILEIESNTTSREEEQTLAAWDGTVASAGPPAKSAEYSWVANAFNVALEYVGDAIEFLRTAVKSTVKFVVKTAGSVLKFVLKYGSKILSFVVRNTASLVRSVVGILDNLLGTDLVEMFGLKFSKHIPQIQNRMKEAVTNSLTILDRYVTVNHSSLNELFEDGEDILFDKNEEAADLETPHRESTAVRQIRSIINSPIVRLLLKFNPISWILEGVTEGLSETFSDYSIPDFGDLARALRMSVGQLANICLEAFMNIVDAIATCAADATSGPKEIMPIMIRAAKRSFRKAFHATRDITLQVFESITRMIKAIPNLLTQAWKVPGLTDLWEDWIGQEFSLLNFTSYVFALTTSILPPVPSDKQMDLMFGKPIVIDWTQVRIEPFYHRVRRAKNQAAIAAEHTDPVVVTIVTERNPGKDLNHDLEKGSYPVEHER